MYGHVEITAPVQQYLDTLHHPEPEILTRLRRETREMSLASMQISHFQGEVLRFLVRLVNARRILEVGTFTGYSSIVMAAALPQDGLLVAVDNNADWTSIARRYWAEAGVAHRIELRLGDGSAALDALCDEPSATDSFDLAFIDADKTSYHAYLERALRLIRVGGLIVVDNTLWSGRVADDTDTDADTRALRLFNEAVRDDPGVDDLMLPIVDGITLLRRCV